MSDPYLRQLEDERRHREAVTRDRDRIARLIPTGIANLYAGYPGSAGKPSPLKRIHLALSESLDAASPLRSVAPDEGVTISGDPADEGASTRVDRRRVQRIGRWLEQFADRVEREVGGEELFDGPAPVAPVCWRKPCGWRGRKQAYDARECGGCGRAF